MRFGTWQMNLPRVPNGSLPCINCQHGEYNPGTTSCSHVMRPTRPLSPYRSSASSTTGTMVVARRNSRSKRPEQPKRVQSLRLSRLRSMPKNPRRDSPKCALYIDYNTITTRCTAGVLWFTYPNTRLYGYQNPSSFPPFFFDPACAKLWRSYISAICSGPVASSASLSSRTLMNRGNRSEIPLSST